jgi:hypothetical protein
VAEVAVLGEPAGNAVAFSGAVGGRDGDGVAGVGGLVVAFGGIGRAGVIARPCGPRVGSAIGALLAAGGNVAAGATAGFTNFLCGAFGG